MTDEMAPVEERVDFGLLRKAVEYAEEHPNEFNMSSWAMDVAQAVVYHEERQMDQDTLRTLKNLQEASCGTTMCLAGTAVMLAGWKLGEPCINGLVAEAVNPGTGERRDIEMLASELLGFTWEETSAIFQATEKNASNIRQHVENVLEVTL